jgi:hypothetical protein
VCCNLYKNRSNYSWNFEYEYIYVGLYLKVWLQSKNSGFMEMFQILAADSCIMFRDEYANEGDRCHLVVSCHGVKGSMGQ